MIAVRGIQKKFGHVSAVRDVSFAARDGAIVGLLGENGAGKTTTLGMICGAVKPDAGSVHIDGLAVGQAAQTGRHLGALLDHHGLYARLTARENIRYFGALHDLTPSVVESRVQNLLTTLELEDIADRHVASFSQGQRMKVALGRAMVHGPKNLLLDEPTNGLDVSSVRSLRGVLRRLRDGGTCIVFSSHVLEEVQLLCDTIIVLSKGRIVAQGTPSDVCRQTSATSLEDAFVALTQGVTA